jgi:hypothetical protein
MCAHVYTPTSQSYYKLDGGQKKLRARDARNMSHTHAHIHIYIQVRAIIILMGVKTPSDEVRAHSRQQILRQKQEQRRAMDLCRSLPKKVIDAVTCSDCCNDLVCCSALSAFNIRVFLFLFCRGCNDLYVAVCYVWWHVCVCFYCAATSMAATTLHVAAFCVFATYVCLLHYPATSVVVCLMYIFAFCLCMWLYTCYSNTMVCIFVCVCGYIHVTRIPWYV